MSTITMNYKPVIIKTWCPIFSADEEFDELCFEFGLELDEIVSNIESPFVFSINCLLDHYNRTFYGMQWTCHIWNIKQLVLCLTSSKLTSNCPIYIWNKQWPLTCTRCSQCRPQRRSSSAASRGTPRQPTHLTSSCTRSTCQQTAMTCCVWRVWSVDCRSSGISECCCLAT